jgi:hypothetical protein
MARLGELLVASGIVSADKVEQALRAQVVWGGRLGTNLIELGCIDLDGLSRALGQRHGVPAAVTRHFEKADPAVQAQLPAELARMFFVVPLVRLDDRIAVVSIDPLGAKGRAALAEVYGVDPMNGVLISVAAEMRVLYQLERVYKIARPTRYLRTKNAGATMEFPAFDNVPVEVDSDAEVAIPITIDEARHPTAPVDLPADLGTADDIAAMIDIAIEASTTPDVEAEPQGKARRAVLRTLADAVAPVTGSDETVPVSLLQTPQSESQSQDQSQKLGRIAIRRVAITTSSLPLIPADDDKITQQIAPSSFGEATRAIKRGTNRDRVADLVIDSVARFIPACGAALLMVVRGDVAIGWKHFSRTGEGTPEVAVPLDQSGVVPAAIARKVAVRKSATDLGALDTRLLAAVGNAVGDLAVVPIAIAEQVMCLLAVSIEADATLAQLEAVTASAGAAFARLIRDASR